MLMEYPHSYITALGININFSLWNCFKFTVRIGLGKSCEPNIKPGKCKSHLNQPPIQWVTNRHHKDTQVQDLLGPQGSACPPCSPQGLHGLELQSGSHRVLGWPWFPMNILECPFKKAEQGHILDNMSCAFLWSNRPLPAFSNHALAAGALPGTGRWDSPLANKCGRLKSCKGVEFAGFPWRMSSSRSKAALSNMVGGNHKSNVDT